MEVDCPYGHKVVGSGKNARFLGIGSISLTLHWFIDDRVYVTDLKGTSLSVFGQDTFQIVNKPAPSKWANIYLNNTGDVKGFAYSTKESASYFKALRLTSDYQYHSTVELKND